MLYYRGKERGRVDLLPQIKGGLVPVAGDIVEVELNDRPESLMNMGCVAIYNEPVGVGDNGCGAESWTIALRASPCTRECGFVDVEFRFPKAASGDGATWICDLLYD